MVWSNHSFEIFFQKYIILEVFFMIDPPFGAVFMSFSVSQNKCLYKKVNNQESSREY